MTVLSNIRLVFLLFLKYLNFPRLFTLLKDNKQFHLTKILIKVGPEATKVCCGLMASKIIINKKLEMTIWEYFQIRHERIKVTICVAHKMIAKTKSQYKFKIFCVLSVKYCLNYRYLELFAGPALLLLVLTGQAGAMPCLNLI